MKCSYNVTLFRPGPCEAQRVYENARDRTVIRNNFSVSDSQWLAIVRERRFGMSSGTYLLGICPD
jgi:hypothetical protein